MGVLTTTYQVPRSIQDRVIQRPELIDHLFYPEDQEAGLVTPADVGLPADWQPNSFDFDKMWDDYLGLYGQSGRRDWEHALADGTTKVEHPGGAWIRYWSREELRRIAELMSEFSVDELHAQCLAVANLRDEDGQPYAEKILPL